MSPAHGSVPTGNMAVSRAALALGVQIGLGVQVFRVYGRSKETGIASVVPILADGPSWSADQCMPGAWCRRHRRKSYEREHGVNEFGRKMPEPKP